MNICQCNVFVCKCNAVKGSRTGMRNPATLIMNLATGVQEYTDPVPASRNTAGNFTQGGSQISILCRTTTKFSGTKRSSDRREDVWSDMWEGISPPFLLPGLAVTSSTPPLTQRPLSTVCLQLVRLKKERKKQQCYGVCFSLTLFREEMCATVVGVWLSSGLVVGQLQELGRGVGRISLLAALQFSHVLSGLVMDLDRLSRRTWRKSVDWILFLWFTTCSNCVLMRYCMQMETSHTSGLNQQYPKDSMNSWVCSAHPRGRCASSAGDWRWASWASWTGWRGL